jgi:hypothetical protein
MLWLCPFTLAHLPHSVVVSAAAPVDVDPLKPWYLILHPQKSTVLYRTLNGGRQWESIGGDARSDTLRQLWVQDSGRLLALADTRLWWSDDQGTSWQWRELEEKIWMLGGRDELLMLGASGLYRGLPEGEFELEPVVATNLATSLYGTVLWKENRLYQWNNGLIALPPAPESIETASIGESTVWAGNTEGQLWKLAGEQWIACAPLLIEASDSPHMAVRGIAEVGGLVYAVAGWRGPFVSEDGCSSWRDRHAPLDPEYSGNGSADTEKEGFSSFQVGSSVLLAGWMGAASSPDQGMFWQQGWLLGAGYTRGLAFTAAWPDDPTLFIGGYGAGVVRSDVLGEQVTPGTGFTDTNVQAIKSTPDPKVIYSLTNHIPWISADGGESWSEIEGFEFVGMLEPWSADHLWVQTRENEVKRLIESWDRGQSFNELDPQIQDGKLAFWMGEEYCVANDNWLRCGQESSWREVWQSESTIVTGFKAEDALYLSNASGVWRIEVDQAVQELSYESDPVVELVAAGSTVFAATLSARLLVRGQEGWQDTGVQLHSEITIMMTLPDYASNPAVYLGSLDGTFKVENPESDPLLVPWAKTEWLDDRVSWAECLGCSRSSRVEGYHLAGVTRLKAGQVFETALRGDVLKIWGIPGREAEVVVDGVSYGGFSEEEGKGITVIKEIAGLGTGWHEVQIEALSDGVLIDGVEGTNMPSPVENTKATLIEEEKPCGCRSGGAWVFLLLPSLYRRSGTAIRSRSEAARTSPKIFPASSIKGSRLK